MTVASPIRWLQPADPSLTTGSAGSGDWSELPAIERASGEIALTAASSAFVGGLASRRSPGTTRPSLHREPSLEVPHGLVRGIARVLDGGRRDGPELAPAPPETTRRRRPAARGASLARAAEEPDSMATADPGATADERGPDEDEPAIGAAHEAPPAAQSERLALELAVPGPRVVQAVASARPTAGAATPLTRVAETPSLSPLPGRVSPSPRAADPPSPAYDSAQGPSDIGETESPPAPPTRATAALAPEFRPRRIRGMPRSEPAAVMPVPEPAFLDEPVSAAPAPVMPAPTPSAPTPSAFPEDLERSGSTDALEWEATTASEQPSPPLRVEAGMPPPTSGAPAALPSAPNPSHPVSVQRSAPPESARPRMRAAADFLSPSTPSARKHTSGRQSAAPDLQREPTPPAAAPAPSNGQVPAAPVVPARVGEPSEPKPAAPSRHTKGRTPATEPPAADAESRSAPEAPASQRTQKLVSRAVGDRPLAAAEGARASTAGDPDGTTEPAAKATADLRRQKVTRATERGAQEPSTPTSSTGDGVERAPMEARAPETPDDLGFEAATPAPRPSKPAAPRKGNAAHTPALAAAPTAHSAHPAPLARLHRKGEAVAPAPALAPAKPRPPTSGRAETAPEPGTTPGDLPRLPPAGRRAATEIAPMPTGSGPPAADPSGDSGDTHIPHEPTAAPTTHSTQPPPPQRPAVAPAPALAPTTPRLPTSGRADTVPEPAAPPRDPPARPPAGARRAGDDVARTAAGTRPRATEPAGGGGDAHTPSEPAAAQTTHSPQQTPLPRLQRRTETPVPTPAADPPGLTARRRPPTPGSTDATTPERAAPPRDLPLPAPAARHAATTIAATSAGSRPPDTDPSSDSGSIQDRPEPGASPIADSRQKTPLPRLQSTREAVAPAPAADAPAPATAGPRRPRFDRTGTTPEPTAPARGLSSRPPAAARPAAADAPLTPAGTRSPAADPTSDGGDAPTPPEPAAAPTAHTTKHAPAPRLQRMSEPVTPASPAPPALAPADAHSPTPARTDTTPEPTTSPLDLPRRAPAAARRAAADIAPAAVGPRPPAADPRPEAEASPERPGAGPIIPSPVESRAFLPELAGSPARAGGSSERARAADRSAAGERPASVDPGGPDALRDDMPPPAADLPARAPVRPTRSTATGVRRQAVSRLTRNEERRPSTLAQAAATRAALPDVPKTLAGSDEHDGRVTDAPVSAGPGPAPAQLRRSQRGSLRPPSSPRVVSRATDAPTTIELSPLARSDGRPTSREPASPGSPARRITEPVSELGPATAAAPAEIEPSPLPDRERPAMAVSSPGLDVHAALAPTHGASERVTRAKSIVRAAERRSGPPPHDPENNAVSNPIVSEFPARTPGLDVARVLSRPPTRAESLVSRAGVEQAREPVAPTRREEPAPRAARRLTASTAQVERAPAAAPASPPAVLAALPTPPVPPAAVQRVTTLAGADNTSRERLSEAPDDELEELAERLYDHIRARFRSELLIDRERAGLLADVY